MAGADAGSTRGQGLAAVAPAAGRLPAGLATGARAADLVEAPGQSSAELLRVTLLPGADAAFAHARRARCRIDLPALQRYARAVRGDPRRVARRFGILGLAIQPCPRRRPLGRSPAQERRGLRPCLRKGGGGSRTAIGPSWQRVGA